MKLSTVWLLLCAAPLPAPAAPQSTGFERHELDREFYCEGAAFGDLDGDGVMDVVSGPFVYVGPGFEERFELYPAKPFDPLQYSDCFLSWTLDVDQDGDVDVVKVGYPGIEAFWYENPGQPGAPWARHLLHDNVDNESPALVDLTGDGRPELVCNSGGAFCYLTQAEDPRAPWVLHRISADLGKQRFTHGLGVGDVSGDGRPDVLELGGWWEQPESLEGDPLWQHHAYPFSREIGGAQMYAYDIDGDGDSDVVASLNAHAWGLSWFEQVRDGEGVIDFIEHPLMGATREVNPWGVRFSAPHAMDLADVDGDGLLDLVTGKRHWSHGPDGDPIAGEPSVLYWWGLERGPEGARFVPHLIDDDSGVGTQVMAGDLNGDGRVDVVVGNKQGTFVFVQSEKGATKSEPELYSPGRRENPDEDKATGN